jgi:hypothetical protein
MKCSEVREFLARINYDQESGSVAPLPLAEIDYLSTNGYVLSTTKADYEKGVADVARLTQMTAQMNAEKSEVEQEVVTLQKKFTFRN